jgi:predicted GNAT superfamily acetyltransferase
MPLPTSSRAVPSLDPTALGFTGEEAAGWQRVLNGRAIEFRLLRTLPDLRHAELLQETVYGMSERDLVSASELIVVEETGGAVIGAFAAEAPDLALGVLVGWGGFVERPRVVSDFMAVRPEARNMGLAFELKRLQAAIALSRGFAEIVWTVDPLRAANARLNFGKLGAVARHYEIDRYGADFAVNRFGGMPSDRLHLTWKITSPRVIARLLGTDPEPADAAGSEAPAFAPGLETDAALVAMPSDIDALLAADPAAALAWRLRLRGQLLEAFAAGFAIVGFRPAKHDGEPAYLLRRLS